MGSVEVAKEAPGVGFVLLVAAGGRAHLFAFACNGMYFVLRTTGPQVQSGWHLDKFTHACFCSGMPLLWLAHRTSYLNDQL